MVSPWCVISGSSAGRAEERISFDCRSAAETPGLAETFQGHHRQWPDRTRAVCIRSTGVSTAPVARRRIAFLATLTPAQREKNAVFAVDDLEWRKWMNQNFYVRQGVSFLEMTDAQREAAFGLLRASLSAKGLKQTRDIMRLNETLGELNGNNFDEYGEWRYHITIMGKPSANEPWGWQIDGHHAIINYFVLGDQVVMTPCSPVRSRSSPRPGSTRARRSCRRSRTRGWR